MPESLRWLIVQDRHSEALVILEKLHGDTKAASISKMSEELDAGIDDVPFYNREFNQIQAQIALERDNPQ